MPSYVTIKLTNEEMLQRFAHLPMDEDETWYVAAGEFIHRWVDTEIGEHHEQHLGPGDVVRHVSGQPHQVEALTDE